MNDITQEIAQRLPKKHHTTPRGWKSFDCPCCVSTGESKDTRSRGGFAETSEGGFRYHCFNCSTAATWVPGRLINQKVIFVLKNLGFSKQEIQALKFKAAKLKNKLETLGEIPIIQVKERKEINFPTLALPQGARPLYKWAEEENPPEMFLKVVEYLKSRGEFFLDPKYDSNFYWTPIKGKADLDRRIIIPFYFKDRIVGWNGRLAVGEGKRYFGDIPSNFLFNNEHLYDPNKEYVILVEGLFDALALDGVSTLGSTLSDEQIYWLNTCGKDIIVVPDEDSKRVQFLNVAKTEGWYISRLGHDFAKDVAECCEKNGRLFTFWRILDTKGNRPGEMSVKGLDAESYLKLIEEKEKEERKYDKKLQ